MAFFLGRHVGGAPDGGDDDRVLYKPKHLTTHGLVFGMTGSGKTGLCVGLLEEAARENIPIIAIDPKGDLTNLALCWPDLAPDHFAEWLDPGAVDERANPGARAQLGQKMAGVWRGGLEREGIDEDELRAYRAGTGVTIYTPGSSAGVQVSMLDRFDPPPAFDQMTAEDQSELVSGVVSAVLALVDVDADPLQSSEYILLSNILTHAWTRGQALDLPSLIHLIHEPPFDKLGVFELDEFFSRRKRKAFAMQLNGLIASPSFQPWLRGVPLDMDELLARDARGSRLSVFYIAHLDDSERMSFVSLLLDRLIGWMRAQPGTGDLRALLYMDEVFGYLPPHPKNPPTKRPLLTILKQARAFGLGAVLATQNPVDIDYKAITNAGTWFVGKLQTEQDKERILDGLMSASSEVGVEPPSRSEISRRISALEGRQFLLQNAHATEQIVFKTRFVRSFLRGPMTRQEITRLKVKGFYNGPAALRLTPLGDAPPAPEPSPAPAPPSPGAPPVVEARFDDRAVTETRTPPPARGEYVELDSGSVARPAPSASVEDLSVAILRGGGRPRVAGVEERFLASAALREPELRDLLGVRSLDAVGYVHYRPALMARARLTFHVEDFGTLSAGTVTRLAFPLPERPGGVAWLMADARLSEQHLAAEPDGGARFAQPPRWLSSPADRERARELFVRTLLDSKTVAVPACPPLSRYGEPGETLDQFRARVAATLAKATESVRGKIDDRRAVEAAIWDRQVDELKELLAMDKREIAFLKTKGDAEALDRAVTRAKHRITQYKELQRKRDKFLGISEREAADVEFAAMDKLAACKMVDLTLTPKGIESAFFGLLWIPNR